MIIRSQDKKSIVNMDNIDTIDIRENLIRAFNGGNDMGINIGKYSTEEKAIKVLDMICGVYCLLEDIKCGAVQAQKYDSFCFDMPSDEEVEV